MVRLAKILRAFTVVMIQVRCVNEIDHRPAHVRGLEPVYEPRLPTVFIDYVCFVGSFDVIFMETFK